MKSQEHLFDVGTAPNDKAQSAIRAEYLELLIQSYVSLHFATSRRASARRLERALGVAVASGVIAKSDAIQILLKVEGI